MSEMIQVKTNFSGQLKNAVNRTAGDRRHDNTKIRYLAGIEMNFSTFTVLVVFTMTVIIAMTIVIFVAFVSMVILGMALRLGVVLILAMIVVSSFRCHVACDARAIAVSRLFALTFRRTCR